MRMFCVDLLDPVDNSREELGAFEQLPSATYFIAQFIARDFFKWEACESKDGVLFTWRNKLGGKLFVVDRFVIPKEGKKKK